MERESNRQRALGAMAVRMVVVLAVVVTMVVRCDGAGLLRDSRLVKAGVSEAFSHGDSDTTLYSTYNYLKCTSDHHIIPTSTEEVSEMIKRHTSSDGRVKIRATRRGFHSSAGFVCSGERGSSKKGFRGEIETTASESQDLTSFTMLMHRMNRVVAVDADQYRMTVEAGMTVLELANAMEAAGMSAPAATFPIYGNLTVGGLILTSAHGSAYRAAGSLAELVKKVKWVNAKGEIIESDLESEQGAKEVRALVGGLGLLGVVTEFTLQLQPNSRTIVEIRNRLKDTNIVADIKKIWELETPNMIVFWKPDSGTYKLVMVTQVDERNAATAPKFYPNGTTFYLSQLDKEYADAWGELLQKWQEDTADELPSADVLNAEVCALGEFMINDVPMFQDADGTVFEHGTIPTNYVMVSKDCAPDCFFQVHHTGAFTEDTEFTIKLSQFEDWVQDVKRIVRSELDEADARLNQRYGVGKVKRCMPPGYFWLRFGQGSQNLLATNTGSEDVVYVQWIHLTSAMSPNKLPKHTSVAETIEQLTLCKYKGRPHWGKNHERVFRHPDCKVMDNFPAENIAQLLAIQQQHDPEKVFEPQLFRHLLERSGPDYEQLCTPHMWCYCRDDSHCDPSGSHACRSSASFPEYKVCRVEDGSRTHLQDIAEL